MTAAAHHDGIIAMGCATNSDNGSDFVALQRVLLIVDHFVIHYDTKSDVDTYLAACPLSANLVHFAGTCATHPADSFHGIDRLGS
jgi:hypothetical protein